MEFESSRCDRPLNLLVHKVIFHVLVVAVVIICALGIIVRIVFAAKEGSNNPWMYEYANPTPHGLLASKVVVVGTSVIILLRPELRTRF